LLQGEAIARPTGLAFRSLDERGDVTADKVPGLCMSYGAGQRVVAHGHGGAGVALGHRGQGLVHVPGGQVAQFPGADRGEDRSEDVLVLLDGLGGPAAESVPQPVVGCAPDRVALIRLEAGFEFLVELLQPVLDDGLGLPETLGRTRFPSGPNPRLTEPRHRPLQCRCLSLSLQGPSWSK